MQSITVKNTTNTQAVPLKLGICDTFLSRLRGLMFTKELPMDGGLFFVNTAEDRVNSAIHMFFMSIDLTILWLDASGSIVDKILAKRWVTLAAPSKNAKYIIETHTSRFEEYNCGDLLDISHDSHS